MTLSDFDLMKHDRLPNWGRWGRDNPDCPNPDDVMSSIYRRGKQDETERDPDAAPEPPAKPIDYADAVWLDMLILDRLAGDHRDAIRQRFYRFRAIAAERVDAAVRAILDAEYLALEGKRAT